MDKRLLVAAAAASSRILFDLDVVIYAVFLYISGDAAQTHWCFSEFCYTRHKP
jgi:hypothetical protein